MEKETIMPGEGKEMNFIDLCAAIGRGIGNACAACGRLLAQMVRLSYRYWWLVGTVLVLAAAAALYYTRKDNITYKLNAIALLNGPSVQQFEQAYAPLRTGKLMMPGSAIEPLIGEKKVSAFQAFRVVDCLNDGMADYVDYKHKSSPTDTINVQMSDRLNLQFRVKARDLALVPEIEQAVLAYLNADAAMQQSYAVYLKNLHEEVAFDHRQAMKLDSLTSQYYFNNPAIGTADSRAYNNGVAFYGDRRIRLFLDDIYEQHKHLQLTDYRMQLATAPIVLENHFTVYPKPVNGRMKCLILFLLMGWIGGCVLAELIDKRKALNAWLKA